MALSQSEAAGARMLCQVDLQPHGVWLTSSNDPCLKQGKLLKDKQTPDFPKGIALFKLELQLVTELTWVHGM